MDYINEAFKSLELLTEELFRADDEGINELSDFMSSDVDNEEKISIIDMDAETEDDLQDSYVGKVIVDCNVCHSHVFKDKEDITLNDAGELDLEEDCPYCGENNGFVIVGEIHEFNPKSDDEDIETPETSDTDPVEADPVEAETDEDSTEDSVEEALTESITLWDELVKSYPELNEDSLTTSPSQMQEAFKNVSLETEDQIMTMTSEDNGKVTVTTEPTSANSVEGEVIAPVSAETESDIINANAEVIDEEPAAEEVGDAELAEESPVEDELDFDIEEVDDESMSELGESYLKRVYENVDSFKLTSCSTTPTQLILEGLITFKSGATKNTGFIFEAKDATRDGKVRFIGENAHLARGRKAFTLVGSMNESKKLMCESFTYNYRAKNGEGKSTRVYGKVNRNK